MASRLVVTARNVVGKKAARKLRYDGLVPGVIYGDGKAPALVSVGERELVAECYSSSFLGHIVEAKIGSAVEKFLPKDVEFDPVTDKPVHVDFIRVSKNSKIKVSIAVEFENEDKSPGVKRGGLVNVVVHKLECYCSPEAIPEKICVDLSGKEIGDSILLEALTLPDGVSPVNRERDAVVATIVGAKSEEEENAAAAPAEGAGTGEASA